MKYLAFIALGILLFGCVQLPGGNISNVSGNITAGQPTITDCSSDLNCFIEQSRLCNVSKINYTQTIDFFGLVGTAESLMELNKTGDEKTCELHIKNIKNIAYFSEAAKQKMRDNNISDEQIAAQERTVNESAAKNQGQEGRCIYLRENLTTVLTNWKNGHFSTSDYRVANCTGSMFPSTNGTTTIKVNISINQTEAISQGQYRIISPDGISFNCSKDWAKVSQESNMAGQKIQKEGCQDLDGNKAYIIQVQGSDSENLMLTKYASTNLRPLYDNYKETIVEIHKVRNDDHWGLNYSYEDGGKQVKGELISFPCSGNRYIVQFESIGHIFETEKSSLYCNVEDTNPWGYKYSEDPYQGVDVKLGQCKLIAGADNPATPDRVIFSGTSGVNQIQNFGRYFVYEWDSYCNDENHVTRITCNPVGEKTELCAVGTKCLNGRCIDAASAESQIPCQDYNGSGGRLLLCGGHYYRHSSGISIKPTVDLKNGKWIASVQVINGGNTTDYVPEFSGPNATRFFTTPDKKQTISIYVDRYGQYEFGKYGMVLDIKQRYGMDPQLLNG